MFILSSVNSLLNRVICYLRIIKNSFWISSITTLLALTGCIHKNTKKNRPLDRSVVITNSVTSAYSNDNESIKAEIPKQKSNPMLANTPTKEQHTITVWIHGTRFENKFIREKLIKKIFYRLYIQNGLLHETAYKESSNFRKLAKNLSKQKTARFKPGNFYPFGWSGKLSIRKRKVVAKKLHIDLLKLINKYKQAHGVTPKIRLITHSHGGNVALHFAQINDASNKKIKISELVLLACPAQQETASAITSPTFEKIYSIYSGVDMIQVLDPQGLRHVKDQKVVEQPFFSERIFTPQKNLTQVKIKINRRGITHLEFILTRFATLLPHILDEIDTWTKIQDDHPNRYKLLKIYTKGKKLRFERKLLRKP